MYLYYLLYKIKSSHILWIVKTSEYIEDFDDHIQNFKSNFENYYIIKRRVNYCDVESLLKRDHFRIFNNNNKTDSLIKYLC